MENIVEHYDAVVIGSGHAGSEACLALSRLGKKTLLGYSSDEIASFKDMEEFYPIEEQKLYGVVGIEIELI